jgi:hypothetical protein
MARNGKCFSPRALKNNPSKAFRLLSLLTVAQHLKQVDFMSGEQLATVSERVPKTFP